jgi:hypothetical protein
MEECIMSLMLAYYGKFIERCPGWMLLLVDVAATALLLWLSQSAPVPEM